MLEIQNMSVAYANQVTALKNINVSIGKKKITGIIGPNGAGKSTLLKGILGLIPASGTIMFDQKPLKIIQKRIAYVEQKSQIDSTFPITVEECVALGTYPSLGLLRRVGKKEKALVKAALKQVEMSEYSQRQIGALSGGQFQRILIARTLVQDADLIFLDEPFVGIDLNSERIIMNILTKLRNAGKMILIVHHDLGKVANYFDDLIILNQEIVAYGAVSETFTEENIKEAYGNSLFYFGDQEGKEHA